MLGEGGSLVWAARPGGYPLPGSCQWQTWRESFLCRDALLSRTLAAQQNCDGFLESIVVYIILLIFTYDESSTNKFLAVRRQPYKS